MSDSNGRIAITGANGFVGRAVSRALLARGIAVTGLVRRGAQCEAGVDVRHIDGLDALAPDDFAECGAVIHLAARVHVMTDAKKTSDALLDAYRAVNVDGTLAAADAARRAGVGDRVTFEVASAKDFPGTGYDLVTVFDCLHDMGDPVGAARHIRDALKPDGCWMIVEPFANDTLQDNLNPVGRVFYSASTFICTPGSRAQEGAMCLGAQAGEARMRGVAEQGGFHSFRRAAQTPFNLVYEVRL